LCKVQRENGKEDGKSLSVLSVHDTRGTRDYRTWIILGTYERNVATFVLSTWTNFYYPDFARNVPSLDPIQDRSEDCSERTVDFRPIENPVRSAAGANRFLVVREGHAVKEMPPTSTVAVRVLVIIHGRPLE